HGAGGLDELALSGPSQVAAIEAGEVRRFEVHPEQAGLAVAPLEAVRGGDPAHNAAALVALLDGAHGAYRDIVLLNAAATLIVAGRAADLREGAGLAAESLDAGAAKGVLRRLRARVAAARADHATA
ncbi:anthranilate phosphoribosyltransferase, partial [Endobacter medicaginis]|nr:anthranilate phosphoribosyltransferase [Endobacter medicaginis]